MTKATDNKIKDLFQLLYINGRISSTMLGVLKAYREQWQMSEYEAVINSHILNEEELAECVSKILEVKRISEIPTAGFDHQLLYGLPYKVARFWNMIPYRPSADSKTVTVAMADPTQTAGRDLMKTALKDEFELAVCKRQVILAAIDQVYPLIIFSHQIQSVE